EDGIRDRNVTGVQTCALPIFWLAFVFERQCSLYSGAGIRRPVQGLIPPPQVHTAGDPSDRNHIDAALGIHAVARLNTLYNESQRSEEHTSELQSRFDLVCRLL